MTSGARRGLGAAALTAAVLASPAGSHAHLRFPTVKAERWIELRLAEEPIRIGYRIGFGATLAAEQRKAADRDGDFEVSALEGNAALDQRSDALLAGLRVCTGPALDRVDCRTLARREIERVEAEGWAPGPNGHLHFSWTLRLRERAAEIGAIRLEDAYDVPGVEMTDVVIDRPRHVALTLAGEGGRAQGVADRFTWVEQRRPPGPRVLVAAWPAAARSSRWLIAVVAAVAAAAAVALIWSRRSPK